ncbi:MAG: transcriptional regulator, Crp/Fnr family [Acidobacteriaceae bacterium]|nr:transcriptional regulator, Crp/Fnr family [Acidobacteriaceae bacterium]
MNPPVFKNRILSALDPTTIARLQLRPLKLPAGHEVENPGKPIEHLIFIEDGIGSMTTTFHDGFQVEVGMFGVESVMGASALVGTMQSLNKVYMQMSGYGYSCRMPFASAEFDRFELFHDLILRYLQTLLLQACQSAGCNAHHQITQRLSRWLLLCADRSESPILALTHEYLADMLGSNRSTVSVAAESLQNEGVIRYSRGKVSILDRPALEVRSCECYSVIRDHLNHYAETLPA